MNNSIVSELVCVSALSESIVSDLDDAKGALAALLTDKDRQAIYTDIDVLMDMLESINHSATIIGWKTEDVKRTLEKEDNVTE